MKAQIPQGETSLGFMYVGLFALHGCDIFWLLPFGNVPQLSISVINMRTTRQIHTWPNKQTNKNLASNKKSMRDFDCNEWQPER